MGQAAVGSGVLPYQTQIRNAKKKPKRARMKTKELVFFLQFPMFRVKARACLSLSYQRRSAARAERN